MTSSLASGCTSTSAWFAPEAVVVMPPVLKPALALYLYFKRIARFLPCRLHHSAICSAAIDHRLAVASVRVSIQIAVSGSTAYSDETSGEAQFMVKPFQ